MNNAQMSRRDFLKMMASVFVGGFVCQLHRLWNSGNPQRKEFRKEAKYYKTTSDLAG